MPDEQKNFPMTGEKRMARMRNAKTFCKLARIVRPDLLVVGAIVSLTYLMPPAAVALPITPITACGTVIKTPGFYSVSQALQSTSETVDCIQIAAPGVNLAVGGNLTGPGRTDVTAVGIRVLSSATGVQMQFENITIQGFGIRDSGFGIGIAVEGSGVTMQGVPQAPFFTVSNNAAQGVLISNASSVLISGLTSTNNGASGLELSNASGVIVQGTNSMASNAQDGIWLHASSGNQF